MNAERLLAHYDRIADAPDAIARLRRFILDLAVRGKLVPQDAKDEPASDLLKRIAKEKARLVKAGEIRKSQPLPAIAAEDLPFGLPDGWAWTRLGEVIHLVSGQHLQPPEYSEDLKAGLPYITGPSDFGAHGLEISRFALVRKAVAKKGQLLLTVKGSGVGKTMICDIPEVAISRQLMALTAIDWNDRFLLLITHRLAEKLQAEARSLIPGISREDVDEFIVPLPPLAEQHRIVAKVDELMGLCDRLEAARAGREAVRDRLAAASLARLNAPDPETFQAYTRFALDALPALTTRPDQIKAVRQTILNLAVRGKLVPQDAKDEPASELLKRIAKEKARLVKAGEIRTPKAIPALAETPFPIPSNWRWSQLAEIGVLSPRNEAPDTLDASFVPMPMIAAEYGVANQHEIRPWGEIKKGYTHFAEGDVGLAKITPCFENGKSAVFRSLTGGIGSGTTELHIVRPLFVQQDYILLFLKSPHFIQTGIPKMTGTAGQKRVPTEYFAYSPFPLPPLAEQHRIVAKVDALMALCDRLEASLTATAATRRRLLDALLAEALAPVDAREMEAAE